MTNPFAPIRAVNAWWSASRAQRKARRDATERVDIARAFNDRYCYRVLYDPKAVRMTGTAMCGLLPLGGYRWMCPNCNRIHAPTECSVCSGLQYPACCQFGAGNRLGLGIRVA